MKLILAAMLIVGGILSNGFRQNLLFTASTEGGSKLDVAHTSFYSTLTMTTVACPDCHGTGVCAWCKGHPYAGTVKVDCKHCADWNAEYRRKVSCPVCKDTRQVSVRGCAGCTVRSFLNLLQKLRPGKCSSCGGTGNYTGYSFNEPKNQESKTEVEETEQKVQTANVPKGLVRYFPNDDKLKYGMKANAYVWKIQKDALGFPPEWQTGDYSEKTKEAVRQWLADNNYIGVPVDGSVITYQMFFDMLGLDRETAEPKQPKAQQEKSTQSESPISGNATTSRRSMTAGSPGGDTVDKNPTTTPASYSKNDVVFPLFLGAGDPREGFNPATYGGDITALQRCIGIRQSGIVDQATIDAVKKFIINPNRTRFFIEPVDQRSLEILNNEAKPGITGSLYNTITRAEDQRILHNRNNPKDIIE